MVSADTADSMLRNTAIRALCCSALSRPSARIASSTPGGRVPASSPPRSWRSSPAWVSRVSVDTLSASEISRMTRTDGWCSPRSIWLRYGLDRRVRSASWRSDMLASLRLLRMKEPRVSASPSLGSAIVAPAPHLVIGSGHRRPGVVAGDHRGQSPAGPGFSPRALRVLAPASPSLAASGPPDVPVAGLALAGLAGPAAVGFVLLAGLAAAVSAEAALAVVGVAAVRRALASAVAVVSL